MAEDESFKKGLIDETAYNRMLEEWTADEAVFADRLSSILGVDAATTRQLLAGRRTHGQPPGAGKEFGRGVR